MVSISKAAQVVSWAPLNGGFRNRVSHLLIHRIEPFANAENPNSLLRPKSGRLGVKGTVVGIATTLDLHSHSVANVRNECASVSSLALSSQCTGAARQGDDVSPILVVFIDKH